jgi:hypothetical protein
MSARRESPPIIITPKSEEKPKETAKTTAKQPAKKPQKRPVGEALGVFITLIVIFVVVIVIGAVVDEKIKEMNEAEMPVFVDNFNRQELGENWRVVSGDWKIENGKLVGKKSGRIGGAFIELKQEFEANELAVTFDAYVESESWKPETEIACSFRDGGNRKHLLFDGEAVIFTDKGANKWWNAFSSRKLRSNEVYHITATRTERGEKLRLSLSVSKDGKLIARTTADTKNDGKDRIKIRFYSFNIEDFSYDNLNNNDEVHIDNLKIYTA